MKQTLVFLTVFFHSTRILKRMAKTATALVLLLLTPLCSHAQDDVTVSLPTQDVPRIVFSNTACFSPGINLSFLAENTLFVDNRSAGWTQGTLRIGLLELVQLELTNEGVVSRACGDMQPMPMWGMKLRVLGTEDRRTVVAGLIRGSLGKTSTDSWPNQVESFAPSLADKGLVRFHYGYDLFYAGLLLSHKFAENVSFHCGLHVQQMRIFDIWLELMPSATVEKSQAVPYVYRSELDGFLGVVAEVTQHITVAGELQSLPELAPSNDVSTIDVQRTYRSALAVNYRVKNSLTVFTKAARVFLSVGNSYTEVRLGAEATVSLQ